MKRTILTQTYLISAFILFSTCSLNVEPRGGVPRIESVTPKSRLEPGESIRLTFSRTMKTSSVEKSLVFTGPRGVTGGRSDWEGKDTLIYTPLSIEKPFHYLLRIEGGVGENGLSLETPYEQYFTTVPEGSRPRVLEWTPEIKAEEVALDSPVELSFSEPIERESFYGSFRLYPPTPGRFQWMENDTAVRYVPEENLAEGVEYRIEVDTSCMSIEGAALEERFTSTFISMEESDIECREITIASTGLTHPADVETLYSIEKDDTLRFHFNSPVPSSRREKILKISPELPFESSWNGDGDIFNVSFKEHLVWQEVYDFTFPEEEYHYICDGELSRPLEVENVYFCNDLSSGSPVFTKLQLNKSLSPSTSSHAALDIHFTHAPGAEPVYEDLLEAFDLHADNGSALLTINSIEIDPSSPHSPTYSATLPENMKTRVRISFSIDVSGNSGKLVFEISQELTDSEGNELAAPFYLSVNL